MFCCDVLYVVFVGGFVFIPFTFFCSILLLFVCITIFSCGLTAGKFRNIVKNINNKQHGFGAVRMIIYYSHCQFISGHLILWKKQNNNNNSVVFCKPVTLTLKLPTVVLVCYWKRVKQINKQTKTCLSQKSVKLIILPKHFRLFLHYSFDLPCFCWEITTHQHSLGPIPTDTSDVVHEHRQRSGMTHVGAPRVKTTTYVVRAQPKQEFHQTCYQRRGSCL